MRVKRVPGVLERTDPDGTPAPVVLDSPHSGTVFPEDFRPALPMADLIPATDTYVDDLFGEAPGAGAVLIAALFRRIYLDPNRNEGDLDKDLIGAPWPGELTPSIKNAKGASLIWRLSPFDQPIYDRLLTVEEVERRIGTYWRPYHAEVASALRQTVERFGAVWHLNCHSMPQYGSPRWGDGPGRRPDLILGDRDGTTCAPEFTDIVETVLKDQGYSVGRNFPFKGVELVRRYSDPAAGRHSLQIEINRGLYMDEDTQARTPRYERLRDHMTALVRHIVDFARSRTAGQSADAG